MEYINTFSNYILIVLLWILNCRCKTFSIVYYLKEHSEIGFMIGDVRLSDKLVDDTLTDITMLVSNEYVALNSGKLFVKSDIDREKLCTKSRECCCLELLLFLHRQQSAADTLEIKIMIEDINDHAPSWSQTSIVLAIPEHTKIGTRYRLPTATDPDSYPKNSVHKYHLQQQSGKSKNKMSLVYNAAMQDRVVHQLWLKVDQDLDREEIDTFELRLVAEDSGVPPLSGAILLTVNVTDINDNEPYFENKSNEVYINENNQPQEFLYQMVAKDRDASDAGRLRYSFGYSLSNEEISKFHIDERTGKVYVKKTLDYEVDQASFYLPIQVTDGSNIAESTLIVKIRNENDNAPIITILPHVNCSDNVLMVEENSPPDKTLATITTSDVDNRTSVISCRCPSSGFSLQKIDAKSSSPTKYVLSLTKSFDREIEETFHVIVICHDNGQPQQTSRKLLKILVMDRNDCVPQFASHTVTASLNENLPKGTHVARVNATDCDRGINAKLVYELEDAVSGLFSIDKMSGDLRTNKVFDREKRAEYQVVVNVYDRANEVSTPSSEKILSSSTTVRVIILDVNDCAPVFNKMFYEFSVAEESLPRTYVGSVSAEDADVDVENRQITFSMIVKPYEKKAFFSQTYFQISPDGGIYTTNRILDRELFEMFSFSVEARDARQLVTVDVVIKIEDVNDNHPQWAHPVTAELNVNISQEEPIGRIVTVLKANDHDAKENAELNFEITQGNDFGLFRLDRKSGSLYLAKNAPKKGSDIIRLIIKVSDNGKVPLSNTTTLRIRILRDASWLPFDGRYLEKDLVVMICMISVTLIVSGILIVAIVLLKCKHCFRESIQDSSSGKDNRLGNPDGRSSPTVSELDNSPQKRSSDISLYQNRICRPSGFIYESSPGLMTFPSPTKLENIPQYYTLRSRQSMSDHESEQTNYYHDKQSPQIISFHTPYIQMAQDYRLPLPGSSQDSMKFATHQGSVPPVLTMSTDPNNIYSSSAMMYSNNDVFNDTFKRPVERKVLPSVKWSDMIQDRGIYEAFCRTETNNSQMSKDQITSFV